MFRAREEIQINNNPLTSLRDHCPKEAPIRILNCSDLLHKTNRFFSSSIGNGSVLIKDELSLALFRPALCSPRKKQRTALLDAAVLLLFTSCGELHRSSLELEADADDESPKGGPIVNGIASPGSPVGPGSPSDEEPIFRNNHNRAQLNVYSKSKSHTVHRLVPPIRILVLRPAGELRAHIFAVGIQECEMERWENVRSEGHRRGRANGIANLDSCRSTEDLSAARNCLTHRQPVFLGTAGYPKMQLPPQADADRSQ